MTLAELLATVAARLRLAGIPEPRAEARRLVEMALDIDRQRQLASPDMPLDEAQTRRVEVLAGRREAREPMAYISGRAPFWDGELEVVPGVLVPRPETETLIEVALEWLPRPGPDRILDLGVGSGCLLLTLLRLWPAATGTGVDISATALAVTARNARRLGVDERVRLVQGGWAAAPAGPYGLVVSNPPYVATGELVGLEPEVRDHEPRAALVAGEDGLDAYRLLIPEVAARLAPGGLLLLEVGKGQAQAVEALIAAAGLRPAGRRQDLAGIDRCIAALAN